MDTKQLFATIKNNLESIYKLTLQGEALWQELIALHAADIAKLFCELDTEDFQKLFIRLDQDTQKRVFESLPDILRMHALQALSDKQKALILSTFPLDELTDLFDLLSDADLKKYLTLLSSKDRQQVVSLMQFDPESAGGIMDTDVLTLMKNFTVGKSIHILQRLQPRIDLHRRIFVTDQDNRLVGHIRLEDLVLRDPSTHLSSFMRKNELIIRADEDREEAARKMIHYRQTIAPVVGDNGYFLGVIASDTLVEVIGQEAAEDLYRISAMTPIKYTYFQTPFWKILFERSYILVILLLAQTLSSKIIEHYHSLLQEFLFLFVTMIISTGGNSSAQTSAVAIQGMSSGEISAGNRGRFLRREFLMAFCMGAILSIFSFVRAFVVYRNFWGSVAVGCSLFFVVVVSVMLGSMIPLFLKRLKMDPAYAAGPFLATMMDILGLLIYCYISKLILT